LFNNYLQMTSSWAERCYVVFIVRKNQLHQQEPTL